MNGNSHYALVDCNNFFVSCERVFNPALESKPVIVLSNNDGCVVARSQEVKNMAIPMGIPLFKVKEKLASANVQIFSSNFVLYADMSARVLKVLSNFSGEIEPYSIDESFLKVKGMNDKQLNSWGKEIVHTVKQWTGIPVSVGIGPTRTLAKFSNHVAKKQPQYQGVYNCADCSLDYWMKRYPVEEVWGIGRKLALKCHHAHIDTVYDLKHVDLHWAKKYLDTVGTRTVMELRGEECILTTVPAKRGSVIRSRSFDPPIEEFESLYRRIALFVATAAEKLREYKMCAKAFTIFVMSSRFIRDNYYGSVPVLLDRATDNTVEMLKLSREALSKIYRQGVLYKKGGVVMEKLVPRDAVQIPLNDPVPYSFQKRTAKIVYALDDVNKKLGQNVVKLGSYSMINKTTDKKEMISKRFTTHWPDIPVVKAK